MGVILTEKNRYGRGRMKEGERFICRIESVAFGGDGVAHVGDLVVFIPRVLPGEEVEGRIRRIRKDYIKADVEKLLEVSPRRIAPDCRYFSRCPGCSYRHTDYGYELELKLEQLKHLLKQENLPEASSAAEIFSVSGAARRNKIVLHVAKERGETLLGYVAGSGGSVIDIEECPAACPEINALLADQRGRAGFFHSLHDGMDVTFRYTSFDGALMWRNKPPRNISWLKEEMPLGQFSVPAGSFSQVNPAGAAQLLELLKRELNRRGASSMADVYCGSGLFGLQAALCGVGRIYGIESDAAAVSAAEYNFRRYGLSGVASFTAGDAADAIGAAVECMDRDGLLLVDPPRTGMDWRVIRTIGGSNLTRVVYISCNPSTLGRDLGRLRDYGFLVREVELVNMFPRSGHFEVFTVLERQV